MCELPVERADPADEMRRLTQSFEIAAFSEGIKSNIGTTALKTGQRANVAGGAGIVELHPR